jgi:hypothetical protein
MQRPRPLRLVCALALWLTTVVSGWPGDENGVALKK